MTSVPGFVREQGPADRRQDPVFAGWRWNRTFRDRIYRIRAEILNIRFISAE